ncbi:MAG: hypothetical protein ACR2PL_25545 [Dehalococcoidia bacterium]
MATEPVRILAAPGSEIASLIEKAAKEPVLFEKDGIIYRLSQAEVWATYDPQKARQALRESAGGFAGVDREQLLKDIYGARGQDSQGRPA